MSIDNVGPVIRRFDGAADIKQEFAKQRDKLDTGNGQQYADRAT